MTLGGMIALCGLIGLNIKNEEDISYIRGVLAREFCSK